MAICWFGWCRQSVRKDSVLNCLCGSWLGFEVLCFFSVFDFAQEVKMFWWHVMCRLQLKIVSNDALEIDRFVLKPNGSLEVS